MAKFTKPDKIERKWQKPNSSLRLWNLVDYCEIDTLYWFFVWMTAWLIGTIYEEADQIRYAAEVSVETMHKTWCTCTCTCTCMRYPSQVIIYYETYKDFDKFHITWANLGIKLRGIDRWESREKRTRHSCMRRAWSWKADYYPGVIWPKTPTGPSMDKD